MKTIKKSNVKKNKYKLYNVLITIFIIVNVIAINLLVSHSLQKHLSKNKMDNIVEKKIKMQLEDAKDNENITTSKSYEKLDYNRNLTDKKVEQNTSDYNDEYENKRWFESLYLNNSDFTCWLTIDDMNIEYPVMYSNKSKNYYLRKSFDKSYSISGVPFFDIRTPFNDDEENNSPRFNIIYGHNMRDGTMFSNLLKYENKEDLKKSDLVVLETKYNKYKYKIFTAIRLKEYTKKADNVYSKIEFKNKQDYDNYIQNIVKDSVISSQDMPSYPSDILMLSTCSRHTKRGRLAVLAYRVE